jgi:hypothetical protein
VVVLPGGIVLAGGTFTTGSGVDDLADMWIAVGPSGKWAAMLVAPNREAGPIGSKWHPGDPDVNVEPDEAVPAWAVS